MREINIVEPAFVTSFKCIGSACKDHCCKSWDITLDKNTVNRYLKSSQIEIKNIAVENIITTKESFGRWGKMKIAAGSNCAFMDEEKLCRIHKKLGAAALSHTCATFPRAHNVFKYEVRNTITLSCPEAARQLVAQPEAMLFNETKTLQPQPNSAGDVNQEQRLISLMCSTLLKDSGIHAEEGIYSLVGMFLYFDKIKNDENRLEKMENYFFQSLDALNAGNVTPQLAQLKPDYNLQWSLLMLMQTFLASKTTSRSSSTLQHYVTKLIYLQAEGLEQNDVSVSMQRLDRAWNNKVLPWLHAHPHVMSNYLQYRVYNDNFPASENGTHLSELYLLTAEWFLLKSLISACADLVGEVIEDDVVNIIYSFHSVTKHDKDCAKVFKQFIESTKVNDDLSLIYLLK